MNEQKSTIAILDSGVGGLSIFQAIRQALPNLSIVYGCDNKNFPYGPKTPALVTHCINELVSKIRINFDVKLIVIACNTASTIALESLRQNSSIPIVGVVPAIKPAVEKSRTKTIGLLATPGTILRSYTDKLIEEFAPKCEVIKVGSTRLVELAEEKSRGKIVSISQIQKELAPFFPLKEDSPIDTIVLGCTHFPLLFNELCEAVPKPIQWIDSSEAIAIRVKALIPSSQALSSSIKPTFQAVFTESNTDSNSLTPLLKSLGFSSISQLK